MILVHLFRCDEAVVNIICPPLEDVSGITGLQNKLEQSAATTLILTKDKRW